MLKMADYGGMSRKDLDETSSELMSLLTKALEPSRINADMNELAQQTARAEKTNAEGRFAFNNTKQGKYILMAQTSVVNQDIYWFRQFEKTDAPLTVTLDNDNALIVTKD